MKSTLVRRVDPVLLSRGKKLSGAAAHQHVGLGGKELLDDVLVGGAPARVRDHRGGRGVLDLGVGHDADRQIDAAA